MDAEVGARPTGRRLFVAPAIAFAAFGGLVLAVTQNVAYAVFLVLGPLAGGFAREWQSCCAEFSFALLPFGAVAVGAGLAVLRFVPARTNALRVTRRVSWGLGWAVWFGLGVLSYLHALE